MCLIKVKETSGNNKAKQSYKAEAGTQIKNVSKSERGVDRKLQQVSTHGNCWARQGVRMRQKTERPQSNSPTVKRREVAWTHPRCRG